MSRTDALKDYLLYVSPYVVPGQYGALFTTDPGLSGANTNEVTGGTYARQPLPWDPPVAGPGPGERSIVAEAIFDVPAGVTVTHVATCLSANGPDVMDVTTLVPAYGPVLVASTLTVTFTSVEGG
jgi:hypothetical protein